MRFNDFKVIAEAQFNSKQEVIDHFVKQGKSAAAGASAWERGWRGHTPKKKEPTGPVRNYHDDLDDKRYGETNEAAEDDNRCMQCGMKNCKCPGDSCKCKPIAGWVPGKGFKKAMEEAALNEAWSKKYKNSINCSHPKGFSQKAHCAGKKKHNESIEMEMVCDECGMCQTHGNLNEIKKGQKDSNGYTKCWTGYHAAGTKKGKNGKPVRNCVPNEDIESLEAQLAEAAIGTAPKRPSRPGSRPARGHEAAPRYKKVEKSEEEQFCEECGGSLAEAGKASRALCVSSKADSELGASQLASCKSQGLRAREGKKSHKIGKTRVVMGGKKVKGRQYGGPIPDWSE